MSYSPTQTARFTRCPTKWWLARQGWQLRNVYKNRIAAIAGQAFHSWAEQYYRSGREDVSPLVAQAAFDQEIEELRQRGHVIYADDALIQYPAHLLEGIQQYPAVDPIPRSWTLTVFEEEQDDGSRIDLGGFDQHGTPFYLDFKTTMWCKPEDLQGRLMEYVNSWQCYHYAWQYGKKLGVDIKRFYIVFVVFRPKFTVKLQPFEIDPEVMEWWIESAQRHWATMTYYGDLAAENGGEEAHLIIPMTADHYDKWGKCEYYDFCFVYKREPELAEAAYIQIERKPSGATEHQA